MKRFGNRMPRRAWVASFALLLTAACGSAGDTTPAASSDTTTPSTAESSTVPAVAVPEGRTITVTATGVAYGEPDALAITLAVEVQAATTREVLDMASDRSTALKNYLLGQGIPESDLRTTQMSIYPTYGAYDEYGQGSITGYDATVSVMVTVNDFAQASAIVDGATTAVGDAIRVYGLSWMVRDTSKLAATARDDAVRAARQQATELATSSGLTLGAIRSITEQPAYAYAYGEGGSSDIPFDPGTSAVTLDVEVVFDAS